MESAAIVLQELSLFVNQTGSVGLQLDPWYCDDTLTFTSSDESVAVTETYYIGDDYASGSVTVKAVGAGTATITASTRNGVTKSLAVEVVDPTVLTAGESDDDRMCGGQCGN